MPSISRTRDPQVDEDWLDIATHWDVRQDTCYLNHGSFGISPREVRECRRSWQERLDSQPMDFYLRQLEPAFYETRNALGEFLNAETANLVFVENSTYGMNVIANSFSLDQDDEVLLTSHEYGAVKRIWERRCLNTKSKCVTADISVPFLSDQLIVASIDESVTANTKLIVVSHITSETGTILPVQKICDYARARNIAVCVDGPHALAQVDVDLEKLGCDFYTASCHKWLCASLGSGFLYTAPQWHSQMTPLVQSWGRLNPNQPELWDEEFIWMGTRDPSSFFSIPEAIRFLNSVGVDNFQRRTRWLADTALSRLMDAFGTQPLYPFESEPVSAAADESLEKQSRRWFGSMCEIPLPSHLTDEDLSTLQNRLWTNHGIEVPVFEFEGRKLLRVSFHLYNSSADIDRLIEALKAEGC